VKQLLLNFDVSIAETTKETPAPHSEMYATVKVWGDVWLQLKQSNRWSDVGKKVANNNLVGDKDGVAGGIPLPEDLQ
jgi:hypothetical protein